MHLSQTIAVLDLRRAYYRLIEEEIAVLGFRMVFLSNHEQLKIFNSRSVDLLLVCLGNSDADYLRYLQELKKLNPTFPMIVVCEDYSALIESSYRAGIDIVLKAPVDRELISKSILRLVEPLEKAHHRVYTRRDLEFGISWKESNNEYLKKGKTLNLGTGGMFIQENNFLPTKKSILTFTLDYDRDGIEKVSGKAMVRWLRTTGSNSPYPGFGAEFLFFNNKDFPKVLQTLIDPG